MSKFFDRLRKYLIEYTKYFSLVVTIIGTLLTSVIAFWIGKGPGNLLISSNPTKAEIKIDDKDYGLTPSNIKLDEGKYKVIITKPGFETSEKIAEVKSRQSNSLSFDLIPILKEQYIIDLGNKIEKLNNQISQIELKTKKFTDSDIQEISKLSNEVKLLKINFEELKSAIMDNPEKSLSLPLISKDIQIIKEDNKALRNELNRVYDLSKWFIGTLITMTVGLLGAIISIIISKKQT